MELTLEQIKSITTGALNIYEDNDGFHFRRFSDEQLRIFSEMCEQYRHRSHCTAGCQLSFRTNSQSILLDVAAGAKYEILIDGLPTHFFALEKPSKLPVSLPAGDKHIVISLPNYTEGILGGISLDEGSYVHPQIPNRKFLFLGDSITQGSQSSRDSRCYAYRVTRFFKAQMLNQAVGGSRMHPETLEDNGYEYVDCGTYNEDSVDYPDIAKIVCKKVQTGECEKGILVCGTGIGMNMCANKHKGIRAAQCHDTFSAKMTRIHNNANVLVMPARFIPFETVVEITDAWLTEEFEGGRHQTRIDKIPCK